MDFNRTRRNKSFRALLSAAWLPYLIVQCTTCPAMATSLARCSRHADVEPAEPGGGHPAEHHDDTGHTAHHRHGAHHEHNVAQSASGGPATGDHEHAPGADCCSSWNNRTTTLAAKVAVPAPAAIALPWSIAEPTQATTIHLSRLALVNPHQNSPPIYLACLSLLL